MFRIFPAGARSSRKNRCRASSVRLALMGWRESMSIAIFHAAEGGLGAVDPNRPARHGAEPQSRRILAQLVERGQLRGFDLTTMWDVDAQIAADMVTEFAFMASCNAYPDDLGYGEEFRQIVHAWRPALKHG